MKLFERKLGKKVVILTGAMILSLAMGVAVYADTANEEKPEVKYADSIEATLCVETIPASEIGEGELPDGAVEMVDIKIIDMTDMNRIDMTDIDMTDINMSGVEVMEAVALTESIPASEIGEEKQFTKIEDMEKVQDAVKITVMARPTEK